MFPTNPRSYREWRAAKLADYPARADELTVQIGGLAGLDSASVAAIRSNCRRANMAIYSCRDAAAGRQSILAFATNFGLRRVDRHLCANDDGVAELTATADGDRGYYVPYSNRALSWHTDGYYNDESNRVRAFILHCVQDAKTGGQTALLDPEIAYIALRDTNPAYIDALEHRACLTIPPNVVGGREVRPAVTGPVFSYDQSDGTLHMRYSARKKNIHWRDDRKTTAARTCLSELLADETGPVLRHDLRPGQGIVSNNVLHNRSAFEDGPSRKRFLYRARFFDRINC